MKVVSILAVLPATLILSLEPLHAHATEGSVVAWGSTGVSESVGRERAVLPFGLFLSYCSTDCENELFLQRADGNVCDETTA